MPGFQLPADLKYNRGIVKDPSEITEWVRSSLEALRSEDEPTCS